MTDTPSDAIRDLIRRDIDAAIQPTVAAARRRHSRWVELLPDTAYTTYITAMRWSLGCAITGTSVASVGFLADQQIALTIPAGVIAIATTAVFLFSAGCLRGYLRRNRERDWIEFGSRREADLRPWLDLPKAPEGYGHLYVVQFSNYVVKVGQTVSLARRLPEHRQAARTFDLTITKAWASPAHRDYLKNETRLLATVAREHEAGRAKREYFHDGDFDRTVQLAERLMAGVELPEP